jgi:hypothetical protein
MGKVRKGRKLWGRLIPAGLLFGEGKRIRLWGLSRVHCLECHGLKFYYQDWRKNRRRALVLLDGMKEPVKIKGKK